MASKDLTLYYFPASYYSLKVLLALYEKGIPFKERIVNLLASEQNEDWYIKMNQNGEVPVLEMGGEYITESEVIIDVIDHTFTSRSTLVPDSESLVGQEVRELRLMLDDIRIGIITCGVLMNRQLCVEDVTFPFTSRFDRERIEQHYDSSYQKLLKKKKISPPELGTAYDRKLEMNRNRVTAISNETEIAKCLDDLDQVFDKLETRLKKTRQEVGNEQEHWLVGTSFTAADISATVLMFRLSLIGVAPRYFSSTRRQAVYDYYNRLMNRPSVQKIVAICNSVPSYVFRQTLKNYGKKALKVGFVVGLMAVAYAGYRDYSKIKRGFIKANPNFNRVVYN